MGLAIECQGLTKTYPGKPPVEAVRGIDFSVQEGECFGVLGPNGAGKTTTIEILEGLMPATSGSVKIFDMTWQSDANRIRQQIGVSLQETELSERLSVFETLTLFRSFYDSGLAVEDAMAMVSLDEKSKSWVKKLSGGQKQRLAVATALVGDPKLLFLDEPTTGLDPGSRRELWEIIRGFRKQGRTIMLTTHYMEEAERLCDRVAIVDQGKIIAAGSPQELIASLGANHVIEFSTNGGAGQISLEDLAALNSVNQVDQDENRVRLSVDHPHRLLPDLMQYIATNRLELADLSTRHTSLEDVFVRLTGRQFSDSDEDE